MNAPLTLEQVVLLVGDLVNGDIDRAKGEAQLLAHDAALRQRVEAQQERIDKLTMDRDVLSGENAELLDNLSLCKGNELAAQLQELAGAVNDERSWATGSEPWIAASARMYDLAEKVVAFRAPKSAGTRVGGT